MESLLKKMGLMLGLCSLLGACTPPTEEVYTGREKNPIVVVCGLGCRTIIFPSCSAELPPHEKRKIDSYVRKYGSYTPIFVSPCATGPINYTRLAAVQAQVWRNGYKPITLKPTLPASLHTVNCVNLVRGKLHLFVQDCPNREMPPSVETIGSSYGCTTNWNLAHMIINPWNLLATDGDNGTEGDRVAIGSKNYRTGVVSKLDMESST